MKGSTYEAYQLFMQGSLALADIEKNGMHINVPYLDKQLEETGRKIAEYEKSLQADKVFKIWKRKFGGKATLGNKEQLAKVVFEELGYKHPGTETNTGRMKANEVTFQDVDLPFVKDYFSWQKLIKVKSTYLGGIKRELVGNYIHPSFHLNFANTYRSSCTDPNSQNIPARNEAAAKLVRSCFTSRFGDKGIVAEFDFKGLEVAVGACYHKDPNMIAYIKEDPGRMHTDTAMKLFGLKKEQVDKKTHRDWSKNRCVFPMFYGSVYFQCARAIWDAVIRSKVVIPGTERTILEHLEKQGIHELGECDPKVRPQPGTFEYRVKEVEDHIWIKMFPGYAKWRRQKWDDYLDKGYLLSLTGFCYQGVMKRNEVLSYEIQGSAFHLDLQAIIWMNDWLKKNHMKSVVIGEIHDSAQLDIYEPELEDIVQEAREIFTVNLPAQWDWIIVPLAVEMEASPPGGSWYQKKPVKL